MQITSTSRAPQFLPPATKLGQGYIFTGVCDSVHRGGSASVHAGIPLPGPGSHPLPRNRAYLEIRSTSGRYASYWNAILCHIYWPIVFALLVAVDLCLWSTKSMCPARYSFLKRLKVGYAWMFEPNLMNFLEVQKGHHTWMLVMCGAGNPCLNMLNWTTNIFLSTKRSPYLNNEHSVVVTFFAL